VWDNKGKLLCLREREDKKTQRVCKWWLEETESARQSKGGRWEGREEGWGVITREEWATSLQIGQLHVTCDGKVLSRDGDNYLGPPQKQGLARSAPKGNL
jgi:hypothetical protein